MIDLPSVVPASLAQDALEISASTLRRWEIHGPLEGAVVRVHGRKYIRRDVLDSLLAEKDGAPQ